VNDVRVSVSRLLGCVEERQVYPAFPLGILRTLKLEPEHLMLYEFTA
jgi:hypothetical protein